MKQYMLPPALAALIFFALFTAQAASGGHPQGAGQGVDGRLYQLLTAVEGSTWTLVRSRPDGLSCIMAAGRHWRTETPPRKGRGS